jgi:hypothetical protein
MAPAGPAYVPDQGGAYPSGGRETSPPDSRETPVPDQREPRDATPPPADRPGKVSVSVAAVSATGENGRGRRLSCTVALAVAGALAGVTVGAGFLFDLMPGADKSSDSGSSSDTAASNGPQASTSASAPVDQTVPASYLGTWEGDGLALSGALPMGTFRVTVHQAAVGEELGTFRQTDQIGGICDDVLILKQVTSKQLVVTSIADESNRNVCTTGEHEVRLTPVGDDLQYETDNPDAGDPVARMSRVE